MKKSKSLMRLVAVGVICFIIGFFAGDSSAVNEMNKKIDSNIEAKQESKPTSNTTNIAENKTEDKKEEVKEEPKKEEPKEYTFGNGNYICGKDFDEGTYTLTVVKGMGNVICMENDLNTIFGTKETLKGTGLEETAQQEFKNAEFKKGDKLEIKDVTIKISK